uniref:Spermatogenesis associated 22 n=1 Tax=Scophthalmus maximus TaxID=52904 RepID=A0A8D3CSP4_SCOMX
RQDSSCSVTSNKYPAPSSSEGVQNRPTPHTGFSHMGQQLSHRQPNPTPQHPQQRRPLPPPVPPLSESPARVVQPQNNTWKFTNSFGPQTLPMKPVFENSLRILTAVIHGMRHWSQFKDKVPYLFEIFATLDSAVTLGRHGAKTFLMRDGKEVLQCVFYENEQELPRLIRGQVHRCVGNYDRGRDVLVCVSVRPGLPSELRNVHETIKACDAEMRGLVKSLNEI